MLEEYTRDRAVWEENADAVNLRSDILVSDRALTILGDVRGKRVLDLGCGNGKVARKLAENGADVFGIDIVQEQITLAQQIEETRKQGIHYTCTSIEKLDAVGDLPETFDIILSLMVHLYLSEEEFVRSFKIIHERLATGGRFLYGNAHPTRILLYPEKNYFQSQRLQATFPTAAGSVFSTDFYHHPMSLVINSMVDAGLKIQKLYEPKPTDLEIKQYPTLLAKDRTSPQYLLIDCAR